MGVTEGSEKDCNVRGELTIMDKTILKNYLLVEMAHRGVTKIILPFEKIFHLT